MIGLPPVAVPFMTDSYKVGHWKQYRPGTQRIYSYFEARERAMFPSTMFFGLQAQLLSHLTGQVVDGVGICFAREMSKLHFGRDDMFNEKGWRHILNKHGGYLPVEIKAVPEGTVVPNRNVMMTIENTDEEVPWLTNWLETFLVQNWYPSTVATLSYEVKKIILKYLEKTGDPEGIDFKLHDFGYRGSTSIESAGLGGLAHLVNFKGTDNLRALEYASWFYKEDLAGFSIPASEHSTMTSWGGPDAEPDAFKNMLDKHPTGLIACVSDSYDIYNAIRELWGNRFKSQVMERDGCLVIRPDSGDPVHVILKCCDLIWEAFGGTVNEKGYRVFDPHVRLIQGDGIGWQQRDFDDPQGPGKWEHTVSHILAAMANKGYSADNIAFGSGGGLLQKMDRDTQAMAFKCSATKREGAWHDVWKDPVTSHGKASKRGRLALVHHHDGMGTISLDDGGPHDILRPVFRDGELLVEDDLGLIRIRASQSLSGVMLEV